MTYFGCEFVEILLEYCKMVKKVHFTPNVKYVAQATKAHNLHCQNFFKCRLREMASPHFPRDDDFEDMPGRTVTGIYLAMLLATLLVQDISWLI